MRDILKPNGLAQKINNFVKAIPIYLDSISSQTDINKKDSLKRILFNIHLEKTIAHYSVGDDKDTVTQSLLETIPVYEDAWSYRVGANYEQALWLVSIAILCDIDLEDFKKITNLLKKNNLNDKLFSFIIRSKQPDWQKSNATILFDKELFSKIINAHNSSDIKNYLDKYWYQAHSETFWHDIHKNTKVNNYFGYWSWEAAAIAKIKGIDDTSLKAQKYYPYDAVHW